MNPPRRSVRPCKLFFPVLAAGILLSLAAGASFAAGPPDGSAPSDTDNATGAVPSASRQRHGCGPLRGRQRHGGPPRNARCPPLSTTPSARSPPPPTTPGWTGPIPGSRETCSIPSSGSTDFFGDKRIAVTERPESFLRWMTDLRWDEEERFSARSTIRASLRLPRLKKRWQLVFSGETRGDPNALIPEDPGNPGLDVGSRVRTGSTELVYDILRTTRSTLDVGAGVRVKIPPDAFVRTRFQHARPIALQTLGRFTATAFWDARDGFGESNQVDLERWLALPTLLRWSNSFNISEKTNGWEWGTELSLLHTNGSWARRRSRIARDRDADRPPRRADLLGELHAAGALLAVRVGRRDLHRVDRRRRRRLAGDVRHIALRVALRSCVAPSHFQRGGLVPRRLPARVDLLEGRDMLGRGGSAILGPDGGYLAGPLYGEEGDPLRRSRADRLLQDANASTRPATTTDRTSARSTGRPAA